MTGLNKNCPAVDFRQSPAQNAFQAHPPERASPTAVNFLDY
jgi:hypothetical protein